MIRRLVSWVLVCALFVGAAHGQSIPGLFNPVFGPSGQQTAVACSSATGTDITPTMVSNISPAPYVASASLETGWAGGGSAWNAFDNVTSGTNGWFANAAPPQFLKLDFGGRVCVNSYLVTNRCSTNDNSPTDWTLQGSNDDSSYTVVDTQAGIAWASGALTKTFTLSAQSQWRYWKLNITAAVSSSPLVCELRFKN